ncbi:MAG TPA: hypothetical protein VGP79_14860 [Bryobacteraceae bacterium]|nr:hypothetical protein [Bryobacteraceae bacterium]
MKPLLLLALSAAAVFPAFAQQQPPPFVYPVPPDAQVVRLKDVVYSRAGGRDVQMDFYRPTSAAAGAKLPVLIFSNFIGGNPQREWNIYTGWARVATAFGFAAINPDSRNDATEEDFLALVAYLREHAAELRVDPDRIAVYAASAHVSTALPFLQSTRRPAAVKAATMYYGAGNVEQFRSDLPLLWVRAGLDRPGLNQAIGDLAGKAIRQNAPVTLLNHASGYHGFETLNNDETSRAVIEQTLRFLAKAVTPEYQSAFAAGRLEAEASGASLAGDHARAASLYAGMVKDRGNDIRFLMSYGEALLGAKRYREGRAQFDRVKQIGGAGPRDLGLPAARASALDGDADAAIAWLKSIPKRFLPASSLTDPAFDSLRSRADFKELLQ